MAIPTTNTVSAMKIQKPDLGSVQTMKVDKTNFNPSMLSKAQQIEVAKLKKTNIDQARELALKYANAWTTPPTNGGVMGNRTQSSVPPVTTPPKTGTDSSVNRVPQIQNNVANIWASDQTLMNDRASFNKKFGYDTADEGKKKIIDDAFAKWHEIHGNIQNASNPYNSDVSDTLGSIGDTAAAAAARQRAMYEAGWKAQSDIVSAANKDLETRSKQRYNEITEQQKKIEKAGAEAKGIYEEAYKMAGKTANRNANIAAANAGESGLSLTAGDVADIKQDETNKASWLIQQAANTYGDKKFGVEKDIIDHVKNLWLDKAAEDKFLETLLGKDYAAKVAAQASATASDVAWDKVAADAQTDVQKGQLEKEASRMNYRNTVDAKNSEYAWASHQVRKTLLRNDLSDADYGIGQALASMITSAELDDIIARSGWDRTTAIALASQLATERQAKLTTATALGQNGQWTVDTNKFLSDFMNGTGPFAGHKYVPTPPPAVNNTQQWVRNMGARKKNVTKASAPSIRAENKAPTDWDQRKGNDPVFTTSSASWTYSVFETKDGRYRIESWDGRVKIIDKDQYEMFREASSKIPK